MIKVGFHCCSCKEQFSVLVSVGRGRPAWAGRVWKAALEKGWARGKSDHTVYCPVCKVDLLEPSTRIVPLNSLPFTALLECEGCGERFQGSDTIFEKHFSRDLRALARKQGWRHLLQDRSYHDFCPACVPEARKDRREHLMRLVWSKPTRKAAWDLGISDKALEKQCKRWNVPKPPRGFWAKWYAGYVAQCRDAIPQEVIEILGEEFLNEHYPVDSQ